MQRIGTWLLLTCAASLLASCGVPGSSNGRADDIPGIKTCLEEALDSADIQVTKKGEDPKVTAGVFATTASSASSKGAGADPSEDFVMALAAEVSSDETVKQFKRDSENLADALTKGGSDQLNVESGADGDYVWVVAGAKGADGFTAARTCVKR